jgi:endonuclease/exonuclease/phosphatase family metal-dependent hydrolase
MGSFNISWGVCVDGSELDVATAIRTLDADVIALQEVWSTGSGDESVPRIAAELGYEVAVKTLTERALRATQGFARADDPDAGHWQIALLSRIGLENPRSIPVGQAPGDPVPRSALVIDSHVDGRVVSFANVHLTFRVFATPGQVWRAGRLLRGESEGLALAGDFNCVGTLTRLLLPRLRPTVRGKTWPASRPMVQLDNVYAGGVVHPVRGNVLADLGSDHRAVRAELRLEPMQ